jgi:predicted phage terminase large subunit-like protein
LIRRRQLKRELQRRSARHDVNAFIEYVEKDEHEQYVRQGDIHRQLQAHISTYPRTLIEFPWEHGKTTQVVDHALFRIGHNPNLRVKIVCATDRLATERVLKMREMLEGSFDVQGIFPELQPDSSSWSKNSFRLKRASHFVDSTVEAYGVTSAAMGGRADLLIFDDVVDDRSLFSAAQRNMVVELINNKWLGRVTRNGCVIWIGTPWHKQDAMQKRVADPGEFKLLRFRINDDMDPIWPEQWPRDRLEKTRVEIKEYAFSRGFHCRPISGDEVIIQKDWVQFWDEKTLPPLKEMEFYVGLDPAFSEKRTADETAVVVVGVHRRNFYVLDCHTERGTKLQRMVDIVKRYGEKYKIRRAGIESVQAQALIADAVEDQTDLFVERIKTTQDKRARMILLGNYFEGGRILLKGNESGSVHASQQKLYQQLIEFPGGDHDDLPDALDFAVHVAPKPGSGRAALLG